MLGTFKFMVAPLAGPPFKLTFWETYFSCIAGAACCAALFYFPAELLMKRAKIKKYNQIQYARHHGLEYKQKPIFTKLNKLIIRIKKRFGFVVIAMFAPFFLSVPLGSIVVAKFYGKEKSTFFFMLLGISVSGLATTSLTYLFWDLLK